MLSSPAAGRDGWRERLVLEHLPLARSLARRYSQRGEPLDDLVQVASLGLVKAADRFDPHRGIDFRSFAAPTVLGEIRRHFRDRTWAMKVPRGLKDDYAEVSATVSRLSSTLGRSPSVRDIAEAGGLSEERVLDALSAHSAYAVGSLSQPLRPGEDESDRDVAVDDAGFDLVDDRAALADGLRKLAPRERVILHLRFEEGLLQSEIAERVGISQMHVSRLIARSLETLRHEADDS